MPLKKFFDRLQRIISDITLVPQMFLQDKFEYFSLSIRCFSRCVAWKFCFWEVTGRYDKGDFDENVFSWFDRRFGDVG
jgi:hypothetical protein